METALPGIRHVAATWRQLVTPRKLGPVEAAAGSVLPFRFGRQLLASPGRVGFGVPKRDMHHRMVVEGLAGPAPTVWATPVCAEFEPPPLAPIAEFDRVPRRCETSEPGFNMCGNAPG